MIDNKNIPEIITENSSIKEEKHPNLSISKEDKKLEKLVHNYVNRAIDKGLAIFDVMSEEKMNKILAMLDMIPNIRAEIIDYSGERIAITYHKIEYFDYIQAVQEGKEAYNNNDCDTSIAIFRKFVEKGIAKAFNLLYIGLSYMKKKDYKTAIDYFILTTSVSIKEHTKYDMSLLIAKLQGNNISKRDLKRYVSVKESEFKDDINDYYGLPIEEIRSLRSEYSLDEICEILNFTEEEKQILYLIYAREYFICNNFMMGNKLLQKMSQFPNKTPFVKNLYKEISASKKYYHNRQSSPHISLVLKKIE